MLNPLDYPRKTHSQQGSHHVTRIGGQGRTKFLSRGSAVMGADRCKKMKTVFIGVHVPD